MPARIDIDVEWLRSLVEGCGLNAKEAAKKMGCSYAVARLRCVQHAIYSSERLRCEQVRDIPQLRQWVEIEGKTHQWVADQWECANQTISKLCRKHKIRCQRTGPRAGPGHPEWKGGRLITRLGYIRVYCPGHPYAAKPRKKYVFEHRLVMEAHIGRYLLPGEVCHHKNGVHHDNRIENLRLYATNGEHLKDELTGHCPKWSEEGKARILAALKLPNRRRRRSKADGALSNQTTSPTASLSDSTPAAL